MKVKIHYFTQVPIAMTGTASKINTSLLQGVFLVPRNINVTGGCGKEIRYEHAQTYSS